MFDGVIEATQQWIAELQLYLASLEEMIAIQRLAGAGGGGGDVINDVGGIED